MGVRPDAVDDAIRAVDPAGAPLGHWVCVSRCPDIRDGCVLGLWVFHVKQAGEQADAGETMGARPG